MSDETTSEPAFEGWGATDPKQWLGNMTLSPFKPKEWDEDDVDVKILYCGICASDTDSLKGAWGPLNSDPSEIVGHEIVGQVTRVGKNPANGLKVGQLVGIGPQSDSCGECQTCKNRKENYCSKPTYNFKNTPFHRGNGAGSMSRGGFAKYWRGPSRFAIPVPSGLDPAGAAPMMCGGITVFSPLEHWGAGTKAKDVGIVGIGGLGHFAVLFAKAMGARVTAISRSESKKEDALKLGASEYVATGDDIKKTAEAHAGTLDLIVCTANPEELPVTEYLPFLRPEGVFAFVGVSPKPIVVPGGPLIVGSLAIAGSNSGPPDGIARMLKFAADHNVKPWIKKWDMNDINGAMLSFNKGDPRYRYVLVNTDNGGEI
ncbi:hypothetical protein I312_105236 [Cryptococcus bacillisporus CA1280]|uniref:Unplaced genomic scaffold supercont1.7, whole genome shotgun sequence n=2 Tax=Cryptococcus gattii TaxID=552467 RepID=A0A0D0TM08_CRYGA|nr:alcohol dehydrogenase [Cryptococcus bacillisporus CA1280]KIR63817.1 alcohol dehydrogenase [Cryptococcus bacillisporus CA1873]|eukprot:KIR63817.1 alcohol dehydrogenase [Cryptococcus gattii CA1873]